jgi:hypothetical protein
MITIVHLITGLETGGAERMLYRLVARTDRDRFRSVVVSITGAGSVGPAFRRAGVELMTLGVRRGLPDPRGLCSLLGFEFGECVAGRRRPSPDVELVLHGARRCRRKFAGWPVLSRADRLSPAPLGVSAERVRHRRASAEPRGAATSSVRARHR